MNPFLIITYTFILMTSFSSLILFYSFKNKFDQSARHFLSAEIFMILAAIFIAHLTRYPSAINPITNGIHNFFVIFAEAMVMFSVISLSNRINTSLIAGAFTLIASACFVLEYIRLINGHLIANSLYFFIYISITLSTSRICFSNSNNELQANRFLRWISIFEFGIFIFYFIRLIAALSGVPIHFREATPASVGLFIFLMSCNIFRYISYIALRITWVNPYTYESNALNERLARSLEEKDQLIAGLIKSNRLIGISALASTLAHQLSQPLTVIALQASSLKRNLAERLDKNSPAMDSLMEISHQSDDLSRLVGNLRQLFSSRDVQFTNINLNETVEEIIEIAKTDLESKNIHIYYQRNSNPSVFGDKIQIQQVVINLLNNAAEAILKNNTKNGIIKITISQNNDYGIFEIMDNAPGISKDIFENIFELYNTSKNNGLGVGLWLCKTIVDRHHGKISAKNITDSGACFEVQIPVGQHQN